MEQMTASVQLIKALGGGCDDSHENAASHSLKAPSPAEKLFGVAWHQARAVNMLHWLHDLATPYPSCTDMARLHCRVFEQPRFSPAGLKRFFWGPDLFWKN